MLCVISMFTVCTLQLNNLLLIPLLLLQSDPLYQRTLAYQQNLDFLDDVPCPSLLKIMNSVSKHPASLRGHEIRWLNGLFWYLVDFVQSIDLVGP